MKIPKNTHSPMVADMLNNRNDTIFILFNSVYILFHLEFKVTKMGTIHKEEYLTTEFKDDGTKYITTAFRPFKTPIHSFLSHVNLFKDI